MRYKLLFILLLNTFLAGAQVPFTRDFWLNESATSQKINAMAQDSTGYIWLGTDEGLVCYNGQTFLKIKDSIHKPVTAVYTSLGSVWAGYADGGIGMVKNLKVQTLHVANGPASTVTSLYAAGDILWATTEDGVRCFINDRSIIADKDHGLSDNFTYTLCQLPGNRFLVGTDNGVNDVSIVNNKLSVSAFTTQQGLPDNIVRVIKNIPGTNRYLVGTQDGGIAIYNAGERKITPVSFSSNWAWGQVNDILPLTADHVWVCTDDGYLLEVYLTDSSVAAIHPYSYPGKKFNKLLCDRSGNIWCATNQGLTLLTSEYLSNIKLSAPYALHDATALACDENNMLWLALKNELYQVSLTKPSDGLKHVSTFSAAITSLYADKRGRLWIGTWGKGLFCRDNNTLTNIAGIEPLVNESILNITGTDSVLWIAGLHGVEELSVAAKGTKLGLIRHHDKESGIGSDYVYQLYPDRRGNIWMATDGAGVCMYDGAKYHKWDSFFAPGNHVAYTITEDLFGNMWAGTLYKDLFYFHNNAWQNIRQPETQFVDINISTVIANTTGQVISVYQKCIDEWYPKSGYFRHFNKRMGIGIDSTSNVLNCAAKDMQGNIYLPYQEGIAVFKSQPAIYDIRPAVHIVHASIYLKPVTEGRSRFAYDENYVSFYFDGINFTNPERLNFRYILQGYNDSWINTNDPMATFPKLPPGKYTFRVQASLNSGFTNAREDSYSFTIATPFWRSAWFYLLVAGVCVGIAYLYIKVREKSIRNISQLQHERMMFEYEHLKSQVNPHFLFNSLNTLTSLIEENKDSAIDYTVHLADLYRNMLAYRNKDLILLSEEYEILNSYIHIQKSRFGNALVVNVDIPDDVMRTKSIIPLALQLLVENAIKHNIVSAAHPLTISISANDHQITVSNPIMAKISKEKNSGLGLVNIKTRYNLLTKKQIVYGVHENEYIVTLPLL